MANEVLYANLSEAATILVARINVCLAENAVMLNLINRPDLEEGAKGTRLIKAPYNMTPATASDLTEGTDHETNVQFALSAPTLTVAEIGVRAELSKQAFEDTVPGANGELLAANNGWMNDAMTTSIEGKLCGLGSSFSTNDASALGSNLDDAMWKLAGRKLRKQNITKLGQPICGVISEDQWGDLSDGLDGLADRGRLAQSILDSYATKGNYQDNPYGILAYTSNNIPTVSTSDIGMVFVPASMGFVWKRHVTQDVTWDASKRMWEIMITARFIYGIFVEKWGCKLGSLYTA